MLIEELERLGRLYAEGVLTEKEFQLAKTHLLSPAPIQPGLSLLNWQAQLERIDREWEQKQETYKVTLRFGQRVLPSRSSMLGNIIGSIGLCAFFGFLIKEHGPHDNLIGLGLLAIGLWTLCVIVEAKHYTNYKKAKAHYQARRYEHLLLKPE